MESEKAVVLQKRNAKQKYSAHPHRAWLFVDDLLAALHCPDAHQQLALIVIFFAAISISAPISWKKVQFQNCLTWCGWSINFYLETIELTPLKTFKLKEQLHALLRSKRIKRKLLEQVLGLLIWATRLSPELRSWLAPLYADLHSPPGCMISVNARLWPAFLSALNAKAVLALPRVPLWTALYGQQEDDSGCAGSRNGEKRRGPFA